MPVTLVSWDYRCESPTATAAFSSQLERGIRNRYVLLVVPLASQRDSHVTSANRNSKSDHFASQGAVGDSVNSLANVSDQ